MSDDAKLRIASDSAALVGELGLYLKLHAARSTVAQSHGLQTDFVDAVCRHDGRVGARNDKQ